MKRLSQVILGKESPSKAAGKSVTVAMFLMSAIFVILGFMTSYRWLAVLAILPVVPVVYITVHDNTEYRVICESFMRLDDSDRQTVIRQAKKYIETQSTEFGVLTDIGMLDGDFFICWSDVQSIKVSTRRYTSLSFLSDNLPEPGLITVCGAVESNDKKHSVVHTMVIRPERDMTDEMERFTDFALKHNSRIFVSNDYYFGSA